MRPVPDVTPYVGTPFFFPKGFTAIFLIFFTRQLPHLGAIR
jgi:hypothetical protein